MRKSQFTKFINSLEEDELREELDKLFSKYKDIKEFYSMELGSDDDRKKLLDKAKNGIGKLYVRYKTRSRITKVNNILKDIAAISIFDHELADVYIHHAECATSHINYFGWARDADLNHLATSFKKGVDLATSSQTAPQYKERLQKVLSNLHSLSWYVDGLEIYLDDNLI